MEGCEGFEAFVAQDAAEVFRFAVAQVDDQESVEAVAEGGVEVEGEDAAVQFEVLAQEDREALARRVDARDQVAEVV